jgi:hypothetical protein
MTRLLLALAIAGWLWVAKQSTAALTISDSSPASVQKEQLSKLQSLVGQWRGVGQPQRSSTKDSWVEEADWAWQFEKGVPSLVAKLPKGRFFSELRLAAAAGDGQYALKATSAAGGEPIVYAGSLDKDGQLILATHQPREGLPQRLSFRFVAGGDRLLLLMEKAGASSGQFVRLAEVGYTRQGSGFGKNVAQRECIVTGGLGTIEVTHNGKTYFVCCTGCRDYFNENPEKVLAELAAKNKGK